MAYCDPHTFPCPNRTSGEPAATVTQASVHFCFSLGFANVCFLLKFFCSVSLCAKVSLVALNSYSQHDSPQPSGNWALHIWQHKKTLMHNYPKNHEKVPWINWIIWSFYVNESCISEQKQTRVRGVWKLYSGESDLVIIIGLDLYETRLLSKLASNQQKLQFDNKSSQK